MERAEQSAVIVSTNINGDIIPDVSSALVDGLGLALSANVGNDVAIFEAPRGRWQKRHRPRHSDPHRGRAAALTRV
jgi:isocitrate/isopropylmalate dehydrogenase